MIIRVLWSSEWTAHLFNHLWQSTFVLLVAWLLTLLVRRNPARVRHSIWMLASIKFLVPFALLAALGAHWAKPVAGRSVSSAIYTAADEFGQPFQQTMATAGRTVASVREAPPNAYVLAFVAALWLCGFIAALTMVLVRWHRTAAIAHDAIPVPEGREVEALRRAESTAGLRKPIPMRVSSRAIEPGIFGILHPVLLWPAGISAQLNDAQVESIVAHEVEHVRRRDNLMAAVHVLVEVLFWFHPAVRWMGARLLDERERACDERVLELSARPETYAESILKVCAFCLESPTPCVSGVSGYDLKQRVLRIMTHPTRVGLSTVRKISLAAAALFAVAIPLGFGMLHALQAATQIVHAPATPGPTFEVVSIKPNHDSGKIRRIGMLPTGFTAVHASLKDMIGVAFELKGDSQLIGGPSWMDSEYFDVEAKENETDIEAAKSLTMDQRRNQLSLMIQSMLADRFALKTLIETRELPVYALVVAKAGLKMKPVQVDPMPPLGTPPPPGAHLPRLTTHDGHQWTATAFPLSELSHWLSHFEEMDNRVVVDETGVTGNYDFVLNGVSMGPQPGEKRDPSEETSVSIFTALQDQLGLKLEPRKAPVEVLVVESAQLPSPN